MEIKVIKHADPNYPQLLRETSSPPKQIFVRGELPDQKKVHIAIVGTRKATSEGRALAKKIGKLCAEKEWVVISGLAMGIDTAAHEGALEGGGETIAVLACGVDRVYPAQNENLAKKILSNRGAIISEYANGTPPLQHRFLERNRIVAGLSIATIVIEAPAKSGALVTARLAAEYGREVFVFPGPAGHPQHKGSHALIRDGARLVNSFEDILEDLEGSLFENQSGTAPYRNQNNFSPAEKFSSPSSSWQNLAREDCGMFHTETVPAGSSLSSTPSLFDKERYSDKSNFSDSRTECLGDAPSLVSEGVGASRVKTVAHRRSERTVASGRESEELKTILKYLSESKTPLSVDKMIELTNLTPQVINQELSELILGRIIEEDGFGYRIATSH